MAHKKIAIRIKFFFIFQLTNVEFIGSDVTIPPKLSDQIQASVSVPSEAGNPQVGFDPTVSRVYNGETLKFPSFSKGDLKKFFQLLVTHVA